MNKLMSFNHEEFGTIRVVREGDELYFVGFEVAESLGYKRPNNAINRHVLAEDKKVMKAIRSNGRPGDVVFINEPGLYSLILRSNLDSSREFKRWVTKEVLPSIRKYGMYATDDLLDDPDLAIEVFKQLKESRDKNKKLLEEKKKLENKIKIEKPFSNIGKIMMKNVKKSVPIGNYCKTLKNVGIDMGRNTLFKWLRDNGYLISSKGFYKNTPYQKYLNMNIFELKAYVDEEKRVVNYTTYVTPKGQNYLYEKIKEDLYMEEIV